MGIASTDTITGKPTFNNTSTTQADLQAAADFAEKGLGESVPTAAELPPDGGVPGRHMWVVSERRDYVWGGDTDGWIPTESPWTVFTPTFTGIVLGTGGSVLYSRYATGGGMLNLRLGFQLGTAGFSVTDPVITPPVPIGGGSIDTAPMGWAAMIDSSAGALGRYYGPTIQSGTNIRPRYLSGTSAIATQVGSTTPFTWATGDQLLISASYPL